MEILKQAKRFHATVSFMSDTGLKACSDTVQKHNLLMKDFPIDDLLSATTLPRLRDALVLIFAHLNKKLKISPYPIRRAIQLCEAISRDLYDGIIRVLGGNSYNGQQSPQKRAAEGDIGNRPRPRYRNLMRLDYTTFMRLNKEADQLFQTWDEQMKEFVSVARDQTRRRAEKFVAIRLSNVAHAVLQEKLSFVAKFRMSHEQLCTTIGKVLSSSTNSHQSNNNGKYRRSVIMAATDSEATKTAGDLSTSEEMDTDNELASAYEVIANIDALDTSPEGADVWTHAEQIYNDKIAHIENRVITKLRGRLAAARTSKEMFKVFAKFNSLFIRPKVRIFGLLVHAVSSFTFKIEQEKV